MSIALARAAALTSLTRYKRSWGLWLILLVGPIGARYMVGRTPGTGVEVAVNGRVPLLTWPVLGVWLGIVTATLLLPAAWIYLRSSVTKVQPWQVEDVSPARRTTLALGKFAADAAILLLALTALTVAGVILGALWIGAPYDAAGFALGLWMTAAPPLVFIAALRQLFAARPKLGGGLGDFLFFILWIASLMGPIAASSQPSSFSANLADFPGFVRPLMGPKPSPKADFRIGGFELDPTVPPIPIDAMSNLQSSGYASSRLGWLGLAIMVAALGGLLYRTRTAGRRRRFGWLSKLGEYGPPKPADPTSPPARLSRLAFPALAWREARLSLAGRIMPVMACAITALGTVGDYRKLGSSAALLLLVLAFSAQAGRSEARGMKLLMKTVPHSPMVRRLAFILGGTLLSLAMAIPAAATRMSPIPLELAGATGLIAATVAIALAALSGGPTAPRVLLLIAWYFYFSS